MAEHLTANKNCKGELDATRDPRVGEGDLNLDQAALTKNLADVVRGRTKFETRGEKLGHRIRDFTYRRVS